jgi:hypothetical protein
MRDPAGRVLAAVTMVIGSALFVRLVRAVFRCGQRHACAQRGSDAHDPDTARCRDAGREIISAGGGRTAIADITVRQSPSGSWVLSGGA